MNAEIHLPDFSLKDANQSQANLLEFQQQLEKLFFENALDSSTLDLVNQLQTALKELNKIHDLPNQAQQINNIILILEILKPKLRELSQEQEQVEKLNRLFYLVFNNLEKQRQINAQLLSILEDLNLQIKNSQDFFELIHNLLFKLENLLNFLEKQGKNLSQTSLSNSKTFILKILEFLKSDLQNYQINRIISDEVKLLIKSIYRYIFTILGLISYLKQEKEKTEPPKPTNTFQEFVKRLDLTPEEQLEKNKPAMKLLEKWMRETQEMTEEESAEREEFFEKLKKDIDAERPEGFKLYS